MPHARGPSSLPLSPDQELKPIEEKAVRLIAEGRVHVQWTESQRIAAAGVVDGETDTYQVSFSPAGRVCTCEAGQHHRTCSHALALELVVMAGTDLQLELL
jgi:hypothetical protein